MNSIWIFSAVILALVFQVSAHSQMRCAKYDVATGACYAPIRNSVYSMMQEAYSWNNGAPVCQFPMSNPISSHYSNGAACPDWAGCPDAMGNYTLGEQFTIMWYARNHAVDNQNPGKVYLYISPLESDNQGTDASQATFENNLICSGAYMNCGGVNQDTTPCTLTCTMPKTLQTGIYTLWWKWVWGQGAMYSTCADIKIIGGSPSIPSTTGPQTSSVQTTGVQTSAVQTTGVQTTGVQTTGVQTTGVQTTGVQTTGVQTTGIQTSAAQTTGPQTSSVQTTGVQTSSAQTTAMSTGVVPSTGDSCLGDVTLNPSISQAVMTVADTWGSGSTGMFRAEIELHAQEATLSNWVLRIDFPSTQTNAKLQVALNGGNIACQSSSHAIVQPNSWTKNVASGTDVKIEIIGSNHGNLSKEQIISMTQLHVLTRA